jgi:PPP family 3-phenylpropionic acid transporter
VLPLRLVVLSIGAALGVFYPFISVILAGLGFRPAEIGLIASAGAVGFTLIVHDWGHLADVRLGRSRTLQVTALGASAAVGALAFSWPPLVIALLFMAYWLFESAWAPLADALTVNAVGRRDYPRIRLLTSLSFAASTVVAGAVFDRVGFGAAFPAAVTLGIVIALTAGWVPDVARVDLARADLGHTDLAQADAGRQVGERTSSKRAGSKRGSRLGSAGVAIRVAPRLMVMLGAVVLLQIGVISGFTFLPLRLAELGGAPSAVALSAGVSATAEIPAMLVAARVAERIGLRGMFLGSALIYLVAQTAWIWLGDPALIIATRLLTGVSFAWVTVAVVLTIARLLPAELQATGQALFQTLGFGVSAIVANVVGGLLYDRIGHGAVFGLGASLAVAAVVLGWFAFPPERVGEQPRRSAS